MSNKLLAADNLIANKSLITRVSEI